MFHFKSRRDQAVNVSENQHILTQESHLKSYYFSQNTLLQQVYGYFSKLHFEWEMLEGSPKLVQLAVISFNVYKGNFSPQFLMVYFKVLYYSVLKYSVFIKISKCFQDIFKVYLLQSLVIRKDSKLFYIIQTRIFMTT